MKRVLLLALLGPASAAAHPIEPIVTGAPMPVPGGMIGADLSYSAVHAGDATEQGVDVNVAVGIGMRGEISVGGSLDATEGAVGDVRVGAKLLLLMEGPTGLDLALTGSLTTGHSASGGLLVGRSVAPGFYLQARLSLTGQPAPEPEVAGQQLAKPHDIGAPGAESGGLSGQAAAALQWSVVPSFLPTFEAQVTHDFRGDETAASVVPELLWLADINHLSFKLGVPIGLHGAMDVSVIASIGWQG